MGGVEEIRTHEVPESDSSSDIEPTKNKKEFQVTETGLSSLPDYKSETDISGEEIYVPDDHDVVIDPRLKDYPIPLVARTVDLHNDHTEPILTFRFWFLSTFWVVVGCAISTFYYFKPYYSSLSSYAIQLLAWGMGDAMARWLPKRQFTTFGYKWSLNPGPWNAKEHALIVVAYWGSCYTAYGLGPLSALQIYYGQKISPGWSILFLLTTQMIGYGFCGLFRDVLVRPPKMFYPGVLPNVTLFNAMHKNPSVTKKSLLFFSYVAIGAFVWEWVPELFFPVLASLPIVCWIGAGHAIPYTLGSGTVGFGILDFSLDWNYINGVISAMYNPLWATVTQCLAVFFTAWFLYPILYYNNILDAQTFPAMSSGTYDINGSKYNISRILTPEFTLNQTAMDEYSRPHWSPSYVFYFFWGFAASTGAMLYSVLYYGKDMWFSIRQLIKGNAHDYNDPYLKLMARHTRVPQWWYLSLLAVCAALSLGTIYGANLQLPWWGFIVMAIISCVFTFPNGIMWAVANQQVGMSFLAEVIAGSLFHGSPRAMLTALTYARQILEQNLNLISDYKFGFYMKIPEKEMFIGQVWGTLLGPFINVALMQVVINDIGIPTLTGEIPSVSWFAAKTRSYYSLSVLWGVIGPQNFFGHDSPYWWVYYGFWIGPLCVLLVYGVQRWKPHWDTETYCNATLFFYGGTMFPIYPMTNFLTSFIVALVTMGGVYRWRPVWWRKYHYLLGTGLDCGTQIMQTIMIFAVSLPGLSFPVWWGNDQVAPDKCYPPM